MMRTQIFTVMILLGGLKLYAGNYQLKYITTDTDTIYCQHIRVGIQGLTYVDLNKQKDKLKYNEIATYQNNLGLFVKNEIYRNGKATGEHKFMRLVDCENGYRIYTYVDYKNREEVASKVYSVYLNNKWMQNFKSTGIKDLSDFVNVSRSCDKKLLTDKNE